MRTAVAIASVGAVAIATAPALAGPSAAAAPKPRVVEVADNFFSPKTMTVRRGTKVTWRWTKRSLTIHDLKLTKAPKGVRRFHTVPASAGFTFSRKLTVPGAYRLVCTLHISAGMTMRITVRG